MRDTLVPLSEPPGAPAGTSKAEALHALGAFYVRQGYPKQGLALLLAALKFAPSSLPLNRSIAHAYVLAGVPQKALAVLEALIPILDTDEARRGAHRLRSRALLSLGRVGEAREAYGNSVKSPAASARRFSLVEGVR